ncbi:hypothetical protein BDF14DRAFT_1838810 [Spinellus fusiger]|nr:hypothetical protein BDF14DRAFT_1838810 [Spinellus fusiger]
MHSHIPIFYFLFPIFHLAVHCYYDPYIHSLASERVIFYFMHYPLAIHLALYIMALFIQSKRTTE